MSRKNAAVPDGYYLLGDDEVDDRIEVSIPRGVSMHYQFGGVFDIEEFMSNPYIQVSIGTSFGVAFRDFEERGIPEDNFCSTSCVCRVHELPGVFVFLALVCSPEPFCHVYAFTGNGIGVLDGFPESVWQMQGLCKRHFVETIEWARAKIDRYQNDLPAVEEIINKYRLQRGASV
jgi:hypothetical protein